ncbi:MAG: tetratricopeptide repeat protein [Thiobacillus sp.]|nr:tetratricopeptide repeat protein [Thiobacillus sp.]
MEISNAMQLATGHHQAGRLVEAESVCQQILQKSANHPDALYLLGLIAYQIGMHDVATAFFGQVIEIKPHDADVHNNLGVVLMAQGQLVEATASFQKSISLQPKHPNAHYNLGNAFKDQGKLARAVASFQKAILLTPGYAPLHNNLGDVFQAQGNLTEAAASYRKALKINPSLAQVHYNLGDVLQLQGKLTEAVIRYREAIRLKSDDAEAYNNLAIVLNKLGKQEEAIVCYQQAISIRPVFAEAHSNLGGVLKSQKNLEEAATQYREAIRLNPGYVEAYNNLANVLNKLGEQEEAIACYQQAIAIRPNLAEPHCNLGNTLYEQGRLEEAIASCREAIRLKPDYVEALDGLGSALRALGELDEAVACGRRAHLIQSDNAAVCSNLGNSLRDQGSLDEAIACFRQALSIQPDLAMAYSNLLYTMQYMSTVTPSEVFSEHQRFAERYETPLKANWLLHQNYRDPERRLKIGYVSADLRNHAVAFFIEPILASHDKSQVEIYCYYNHTKHDSHTDRITSYADHWLGCASMSDEQLAERIRADGIDILVDLSGHTGHNRLPVFARKPAPVQMTWIGYPGSTGLTAMDYRITNEGVDPPGLTERYHSESLIRMPDTSVAYRPEPDCPPVNPLPALTSDEFIFASMNNLIKINQSVIKLWASILDAIPHARLMLGNVTDRGVQQKVIEQFSKAGVAVDRLILLPRMSLSDYLALHHKIDLALDPFPYNGGTTTMHSLWMGVPVITMAGEHMASRCAVPLLSRVSLNEFITHNEEEYLQRATQMAQDLPSLNRIRQSIRDRMSASSCEPCTVTRHLEASYREAWRKWCVT